MSNPINKPNLDDNSDNEAIIERLFPKCRPRSMVTKSNKLTQDDNHLIDKNYNPLKLEEDTLIYFSKSEVERQEDNDQHLRFKLNQNEDETFKINSIYQQSNCDYNQSHARLIKEIDIGDHQIANQNDDQTMRTEGRDHSNENKLRLKESKIPLYEEREVIGYRWNSLSTSPQKVSKKSASSQFQNGCVEVKQNSEDLILVNSNKQYSATSFHPLNTSQGGLIQNSKLWDTAEYISTSSLPKSSIISNSSTTWESSLTKSILPHSDHLEDSCYQDTAKLDHFESNADCEENNSSDNNVQRISKSRSVTRSLSLPSLLDYSQKLTFDVLKCQNEIKNERQKEGQQSPASSEPTELKGTGNETMYIGNVPIARYDESPRRYRPKQPGSAQRAVLNEDESSQLQSPFKVSLDELVKSILNISLSPPPSPSEEGNNNCNSTSQSDFNLNEDRCDKEEDLINTVVAHEVDERLNNLDDLNNQAKKSVPSTASGQGSNVIRKSNDLTFLSQGVVKISDQSVNNHKDLHHISEKVHRNYSSNNVNNKEENGGHIYEAMIGNQKNDCKNFIQISPETSECDSNDNESESVSFEGGLYFSSRHNKMPILEDGLSSGHSSSDGELEEEAPPLNIRDSRKTPESSYEHSTQVHLNNQKINSSANYDYHYHQKYHHSVQTCHNHGSLTNYSKTGRGEVKYKFNIPRSQSLQLNHYPNQPVPVSHADANSSELPWAQRNNSNQATKGSIKSASKMQHPKSKLSENSGHTPTEDDCDTDQETDRLLGAQRSEERSYLEDKSTSLHKKKNSSREVLIEGILFRARYLGSTQLICEGQPTKATRMMQAEEAVSRIKSLAPEGETQPSTEVDLFISTEKIMVLNTDLKEIMMDHALRTISYIADIGDLLVLMTRRRIFNQNDEHPESKIKRVPKMICHIFESEEAQFIAQSIGQAFQVAYMEFLKANGIEDSSFVKEMDYQEVLNSQEIFGNELEMFAKKDRQKEVIVPKQKGEILGLVIVESGWGSMLPTVVIANISQQGPAARCGHLNIGDQIIAINGVSLVGLPLTTCQSYIKNTWPQTAVKLTVVPCAPVVEVKIKRPDTKYQLGFSVQNGVICSLLRGGIAERGGVRVGHRIIEINRQSVVAVPHERIVNLLATSVGEIAMKTMPTSMFRLLTGQETRSFI